MVNISVLRLTPIKIFNAVIEHNSNVRILPNWRETETS